jgi:hypothetical protein
MKKIGYLLLFAMILFFFDSGVSASFVCGRVNDSKDFSAVGFNVRVYYQENPAISTFCKVGAAENKYCCDLEEIKGYPWKVGKIVIAELVSEGGYSAGSVSLAISGEGFDIFPEMVLQKVIGIFPELKKIYVNTTSIFINVSTASGYEGINYTLYSNGEKIKWAGCGNCSTFIFYLNNLSYGNYILNITASNGNEVSEPFNFYLLNYLNFNREIKCKKCRGSFVPSDTDVNISVSLNASESISGTFTDYFPNNWVLLNNKSFEKYSESHNSIDWQITNKEITKSYVLHSPKSFLPQKYTFQSEFEGTNSEETRIISSWFNFPFSIFNRKISHPNYPHFYYKISPLTPLVIKFDSGFLNLVSIFPKREIKKVSAWINLNERAKTLEIMGSFSNRDIDKILVRFTLNKKDLRNKNVSLEEYTGEKEFEAIIFSEDEKSVSYESYLDKKGKFKVRVY